VITLGTATAPAGDDRLDQVVAAIIPALHQDE
jgi:hypothetical protein